MLEETITNQLPTEEGHDKEDSYHQLSSVIPLPLSSTKFVNKSSKLSIRRMQSQDLNPLPNSGGVLAFPFEFSI
ncbi:MAG: hypothetical protein M3264_03555 [Thermoproteota archaeon]|nr:hypothetical protein [Thermoproteota archaeon]